MTVIHLLASVAEVYLPVHYSWLQLVSPNEQSLNLLVFWVLHFFLIYLDTLTFSLLSTLFLFRLLRLLFTLWLLHPSTMVTKSPNLREPFTCTTNTANPPSNNTTRLSTTNSTSTSSTRRMKSLGSNRNIKSDSYNIDSRMIRVFSKMAVRKMSRLVC